MRTNYARDNPVAWLLASSFAVMIAFVFTLPIQDNPVVLWWTWPLGTYIVLTLNIYLLIQVSRVIYWQRPSRFHQDWFDSDWKLLKCSNPKYHEKFAE